MEKSLIHIQYFHNAPRHGNAVEICIFTGQRKTFSGSARNIHFPSVSSKIWTHTFS